MTSPADGRLVVLSGGPECEHEERSYLRQSELVHDQLEVLGHRLRVAVAHYATGDEHDVERGPVWPSELITAEARIRGRLDASRRAGIEHPMVRVVERFELSVTEQRLLWLLIAHELSPRVRQLLRDLGTEQTSDPTTDALRRAVYGGELGAQVWDELAEHGQLRRSVLIERTDGATDTPEHRQTWKVSRRVVALAHGHVSLDPALVEILRFGDVPAEGHEELELADGVRASVEAAFDQASIVLVHGGVGSGRRSVLSAVATARGLRTIEVDATVVAKDRDLARRQLLAIARECQLCELVPLIVGLEALGATADAPDRIDLVEQALPGLVLATATRAIARRWKRAPFVIELRALLGAQRARLWSRALPMAEEGDAEILATLYPLAPAFIHAAGEVAVERCGAARMTPEHIEAGLRAVLDDRLAGLATRLTITQTWDDLVLPDDQAMAITELLARIRERQRVYEDWGFAAKVGRGLGVAALFSGPPGTGKTMAAGLVARALRVEVYRVDLEKVTSKWIGETEKNLAALFDAAEAGHAVLLFDEADALFGKRTEVKSSNDRHANQEVNFLLQRLETFTGICILTTNHDSAIDEAFRRRLSVHVKFPMPEPEERERLWNAMIPDGAPRTGDLGIAALAAKYSMSGGYIRNAVLRAAFLAADEDGVLDAARLARAAQLEYEALGKIAPSNR